MKMIYERVVSNKATAHCATSSTHLLALNNDLHYSHMWFTRMLEAAGRVRFRGTDMDINI